MKKLIALLIASTSALSMFAYALSAEKEAKIQTATETIMDYLLVQPREVANSVLLLLKGYQQQFATAGESEKLYIVTSLLEQLTPFATCVHAGGTWLVEVRECEQISADTCRSMGWVFEECASSCRHSGSEICTLQCVPVCSMNTTLIPEITTERTMRISVGATQTACLNSNNQSVSCLLIRPEGQVGWTLMPEEIQGFNRTPGFVYELDALVTTDGTYHYLNTISSEVDLSVCDSYFDGCNTCTVTHGELAGCTRKYCSAPTAPRCLDIIK
jgi:hypothetical protein